MMFLLVLISWQKKSVQEKSFCCKKSILSQTTEHISQALCLWNACLQCRPRSACMFAPSDHILWCWTVCWNCFIRWLVIRQFRIQDDLKVDPKSIVSKHKCIDCKEKWSFLYPATRWWGIMVSRWTSVCLFIHPSVVCQSVHFSFPDE